MLHKNRSKNTNQWKFAFILPLLTAFIFTFSTKTIAQTVVKTMTTTDNNRGLVIDEIEEDIQMVIITKDSNQAELDNIKETFSKEGVTVKFKGIKRNSSNEITAIKINVKSKKSSANFNTSSDNPIKPIKISFDDKGDNIAIGNGGMLHGEHDMIFVSSDKTHKIHTSGSSSQNFVFISDDDENHGKHTMSKVIEIKSDGDEHEIIEIKGDGDNIFVVKKDGGKENIFVIKSDGEDGLFNDDDEEIYFISEDGDKKKIIINKGDKNNFTWNDGNGNTTVEIISSGDSDKTIWKTEDSNKTVEVVEIKGDGNKDNMIFISDGADNKIPLFIIDGEESSKDALEKLDPNTIDKMEVLKGDKAVKKYGDNAKGGAIIITTKKK